MRPHPSRQRRRSFAAAVAVGAVVLASATAVPASANPAPAPGPQSWTTPGAFSTTVPDGVCAIEVTALGGGGGTPSWNGGAAGQAQGGAGASITVTYPVSPGTAVTGFVGGGGRGGTISGQGRMAGGADTGGRGGDGTLHHGGGGGGLTSVSLAGTEVVVAGGGGGAGGGHLLNNGFGGSAGLPSTAGAVAPGESGSDGGDSRTGSTRNPALTVGGGQGGQAVAPGVGGAYLDPSSLLPGGTDLTALSGIAGSGRSGGDGGIDPVRAPSTGADTGGGGGGGYYGGGGGAGTYSNGSGSATANGIAGAGGGGGSSWVGASAPAGAASGLSATAGVRAGAASNGPDGRVVLTWISCAYDLEVTKNVTGPTADGTVTWSVDVTNLGPDPMSRGDVVTLTDTLPGPANTTITSLTTPAGVTCDVVVGDAMSSPIVCSRPFDASAVGGAATGVRGLDVGETISIVYTQTITVVGTYDNVATVTDRGNPDNNQDDAGVAVTGPTTDSGTSEGPQGQPQSWTPTPTPGTFPVDCAATLQLIDPVSGDPVSTVVMPGEGTYTLNGCQIVFTPEPGFTGEPTDPIGYQVTDEHGNPTTGTYTPSVTPVTPVAVDDSTVGRPNTPQSVDPLGNDAPGHPSVPLDPTSLTLLDGDGDPAETVTVPEGVYTIDRTDPDSPVIVFTPNENFFGTPTPVDYEISDVNGTTTDATYRPDVVADPPATNDGETTGPQGVVQSWVPSPVAGEDFAIDFSTLTLLDGDGDPVTELVFPGVGTYTVVGDELVFTPEPDFVGPAPTVDYRVSDVGGQHATGTYTPSITAVTPVAADDSTTGRPNTPQSVDPLANDTPGHPSVPLDPSTLTLLDGDGDPAESVTVPEGVYTIDRTDPDNPVIVFTPNENFFGTPTPVDYEISDVNGTPAEATYSPEVVADPPATNNGETTGPQGVVQTWEPTPVAGQDFAIDDSTLTLLDGDGDPVTELVFPGVGTYTVVGGELVFTPEPEFVGVAPTVDYRISDVGGQHATGTYTPTITPVTPVAVDDSSVGRPNTPQSVDPLANDVPGDPSVPLDPTSLTLLDDEGNPVETVTVPEGVYTIDRTDPDNPVIVFTPNENFFGTPTPVDYRVADVNGTTTEATYSPDVVTDPPATNDGQTTGPQGVAQTWEPTPVAGEDFEIDFSTLTLLDDEGNPVDELVFPGVGTYTVVGGELVFTPEPDFVGTAPTVDYRISDVAGQHATGTYTPSTFAVVPTASDDSSVDWWNTPQSVDPLANDTPGHPSVPLDPSTLTLLDADGNPVGTVTVPEGVYAIDWTNPDRPLIVFTPNPGFIGTPTPVDYRVADVNGTTTEATYRPEVLGPDAVENLVVTLQCGTTATFDLTDEVPGLDGGSVRLLDADGNPVTELIVPGEGTWRVDPVTGVVTFTPVGCLDEDPTPVTWIGQLGDGTPVTGTLTVHYTPVETPRQDPEPEDDGDDELGATGVEIAGAVGLAGLMLALGLGLVVMSRRRQQES